MPSAEELLFMARHRYLYASNCLAHIRRRAGSYKRVADGYWRYQVWSAEVEVMRALDRLWLAQQEHHNV